MAMMILLTLPLVSLLVSVQARPAQENEIGSSQIVNTQFSGQRIFIDTKTCNKTQQEAVSSAWADAVLLANAAADTKSSHDLSRAEWFGISPDLRRSLSLPDAQLDIFNQNVARHLNFYTPNASNGTLTFLSCPSQHIECTPGVIAASADSQQTSTSRVTHYTIFCPAFFMQNTMPQALANVSNNPREQMVMENYWGNQGYSFFHESLHYGGTVSIPQLSDPCFGPSECWNLAKKNGVALASQSADSYALEAMAVLAQQIFNLTHPPVPRDVGNDLLSLVLSTGISTLSDAASQQTQYYKALEGVPKDLFGTTDATDATGDNLDPRWRLMVGPAAYSSARSSLLLPTLTTSELISTTMSSSLTTSSLSTAPVTNSESYSLSGPSSTIDSSSITSSTTPDSTSTSSSSIALTITTSSSSSITTTSTTTIIPTPLTTAPQSSLPNYTSSLSNTDPSQFTTSSSSSTSTLSTPTSSTYSTSTSSTITIINDVLVLATPTLQIPSPIITLITITVTPTTTHAPKSNPTITLDLGSPVCRGCVFPVGKCKGGDEGCLEEMRGL